MFAGSLTITGSHSLNDVTFNGAGVTYTVAAGTTLTVTGSLTLTDGNINTGTVAAQGPISQASTFDGNTGTLLINGSGRPDVHRCVDHRCRQPAERRHQQAVGHADPRRHHPDRPQLDVHGRDARSRHLDRRLRRHARDHAAATR